MAANAVAKGGAKVPPRNRYYADRDLRCEKCHTGLIVHAQRIIEFWFTELSAAQWWGDDPQLDRRIAEEFGTVHAQAVQCELHGWREAASGRLAEVIVLDQFSRNIFRGTARAFAADPQALSLAQEAVAAGAASQLEPAQRSFLYMPYMHSESRCIHVIAVKLFAEAGLEGSLRSELRHKAIIDRFGRYPHRNPVLGRTSSEEELDFLRNSGTQY